MDSVLEIRNQAKPELDLALTAAAPAEAPTPSATADWTSLPADLIRRIANYFLEYNDLDHYVDFRAVCPSWRAATDDPRNNDPRFHPLRWIVLDEDFQLDDDDELLLLNNVTGRFLRKKLPLLRDYYVVAITPGPGGFFVLADKSPPHAARVLNPLTGHLTRFAAPVPPDATVANVGSIKDGLLAISLLGDSSHKVYTAFSDSEGFTTKDFTQGNYNLLRNAVLGSAFEHLCGATSSGVLASLYNFLGDEHGDPAKFFAAGLPEAANEVRCSLENFGRHLLLFMTAYRGFAPALCKVDYELGRLTPMQNLGRFSIFIGHQRRLLVDADKFPGIEANCVYYTAHLGSSAHICKCNIKDMKGERISEAAEFVKQDKQFVLVADRPLTIIQLLCSYTINIPDSQLALQQMSQGTEESCSNSRDSDLDN